MKKSNRYKNAKNEYQGSYKRVLCVCTGGLLRSPTAARVLESEHNYNTRAVGIDDRYALIVMDEVLYRWADEIVVMDRQMRLDIQSKFGLDVPIADLDIPDDFDYMDEGLIDMIKDSYMEYLKTIDPFAEMDSYLKERT